MNRAKDVLVLAFDNDQLEKNCKILIENRSRRLK